ncbi:uncharacterized protein LOC142640250 [Castanea sativa]|uniref:uncharacterized protein LOC142640250 n=1 Tax=Castanea sativa TaxID=21020 RepID=UPI003F64B3EA
MGSTSPEERGPRNVTMDIMSRAVRRVAQSPFSRDIERALMPNRFKRPLFNSYDEKTDLVEHVSYYIQMMSLHAHNDALMCKVFPSSLGPTALRWFNGLRKGSIHSFSKLIQEFSVWFMTYSRVPQPVDALLSMKMGAGETLCNYTSWYWELYNEIGGGNERIVASTFLLGLPEDSELRESLTRRPPEDMRQLMRRIEEYKWVLKDHLGQLVEAGYLKEFVVGPRNQETGQDARLWGNPLPSPLGVIEVIHTASRGTLALSTRNVLAVAPVGSCTDERPPEKRLRYTRESLAFEDDDLEGTIKPHDDALVVTAWISGFTAKE